MVAELTPSIPPPKCLKLSVNDYTFDHESKTLFASLFLHLMCGNWQEKVQLLNNAIHEYNHGVGQGGQHVVDFTERKFIITLARFIGAAGFAGKGSKLWKDGQYKSLVPSTMFGQYRKEYRFKQWCQFVPSIWAN